jgi:teichuronic acid biosynthesis glycosyltransferase TuaG
MSKRKDIVSIIMPNYNGSKYLEQAILSVVNQSYKYWELVIIDDCSLDCSKNIITKYVNSDERIKFFSNSSNMGVSFSRNVGIQNSKGRYIAFLDSDDVWEVNKLKDQLSVFEITKVSIVYSPYYVINGKDQIIGKIIPPKKLTYKLLLKSNFIGNCTGIFDSDILGKHFLKNQGHEDYIFWLELLKKTEFAFSTNTILARYRKSKNSLSSNKFKALKWTWNIYKNNENLSLINSLFYLCNYIYYGFTKVKKNTYS